MDLQRVEVNIAPANSMAPPSFLGDGTEPLGLCTESGAELAGEVLESDRGGQFHDRIVIEMPTQLLEM